MKSIIVSRHPATVAWLREQVPPLAKAEVFASVTPEQVRGQVVYGNLPMHLAAEAYAVVCVEFTGQPPRGQEYGREEIEAAGARLTAYVVNRHPVPTAAYARPGDPVSEHWNLLAAADSARRVEQMRREERAGVGPSGLGHFGPGARERLVTLSAVASAGAPARRGAPPGL